MREPDITLEQLGWNSFFQESFNALGGKFIPGRIAVEDKHHYIVMAERGDLTCQITGRMHHGSPNPADLPKVGDWVAFTVVEKEGKGQIHHVLPRQTKLSRKTVGRDIEEQVLVTNINLAFIVQALDQTFNPALLQRHLLMVFESGAQPVIILNKIDLCKDLKAKIAECEKNANGAPIVPVCGISGKGIKKLKGLIHPAETIVFIGSSGVGKSTLINQLFGDERMATAEVRETDDKGRHTTTWRELIVLPGGGLVIDTPGMREFHIWLAGEGIHEAFPDVEQLAITCHFRSCSHTTEKRCSVLQAMADGKLSKERYDGFLKLQGELKFLQDAHRKPSYARGIRKKSRPVTRRTR